MLAEYERLYGEAKAAEADVAAKGTALKSADDADMRAQFEALWADKTDPGDSHRQGALVDLERARRRRHVAAVAC